MPKMLFKCKDGFYQFSMSHIMQQETKKESTLKNTCSCNFATTPEKHKVKGMMRHK